MLLNEGEVICDKCNGTGTIWHGFTCQKCYGKGKLDWVSNAMGSVKPRHLSASFSQTSMSSSSDGNKLEKKFMEEMARETAKEIDKEIIKTILSEIPIDSYIRRVKY